MIGIDTNVLIRYIVQDDPQQSQKATALLEKQITTTSPGFVGRMVLCEIVWVLRRAYGYDKDIIINILKQILMTRELTVENSDCAWQALSEFQKGDADFTDYFLGSTNKASGCEVTVTFDKKASLSPNFKLL